MHVVHRSLVCPLSVHACCSQVPGIPTECPCMLFTGPWYVGEVLTDVYGLVSVHGVRVAGHFLPGSVTYIHGIIQVGHHMDVSTLLVPFMTVTV